MRVLQCLRGGACAALRVYKGSGDTVFVVAKRNQKTLALAIFSSLPACRTRAHYEGAPLPSLTSKYSFIRRRSETINLSLLPRQNNDSENPAARKYILVIRSIWWLRTGRLCKEALDVCQDAVHRLGGVPGGQVRHLCRENLRTWGATARITGEGRGKDKW